MKGRIPKVTLGALAAMVAAIAVVHVCVAGQFYPNGYQRCLSTSGGRSHIWSVANYACRKAVEKSQNACSTWLGPTNNSTSTTVYATALTGTVPVALWGMCTDRANTSSMMLILNDNGSITCGGSCNFTRSGNWGSPSSKGATLNVAKFIQGAAIRNGMYCRRVAIDRMHGGNDSMGLDFSDICLSVSQKPPEPKPENPQTLCQSWAPSGFTGANSMYGTTTVDIRIKNMNERFGKVGYGDWNKGTIYAMPTDEVAWTECYFGGTPGTGHTKVSNVNGGSVYKGYIDLDYNWCQWSEGVTNQLPVVYKELYQVSPVWQNQWSIWGAGQVIRTGDSPNGSWSFNVFVNKSDMKHNGYITKEGQAGQTFTESGQTGAPQSVSISASDPSAGIYKSYCGPEYEYVNGTPYLDPKTGKWVTPKIPVLKPPRYNCWTCTNKYAQTLYTASVNYSPHNDSASVQIPYNFNNYTGVSIDSGEVYSGETVKVAHVWTIVGAKNNNVTKATYATQVPNAKLKLFAYVSSDENGGGFGNITSGSSNGCSLIGSRAKQCLQFRSKSGFTLNPSGSLDGSFDKWSEMGGTYNAFDAAAGDYMCFVSALYPASSGSDTQMGTGGDGKWRYSEPSCVIISKKPTFQVWGGSLYSVGSISTNIAEKRNIYKDYIGNIGSRYKITGGSVIKFGPWVEESLVMKNGTTSTVSSGAGAGLSSTAAGVGTTNELCNGRANLSFANYSSTTGGPCKGSNIVGQSGIDSGIKNREELVDYWLGAHGGSTNTGGGSYNLGSSVGTQITTATGVKVRYLNSSGGLTLNGTVPQGTTYLIKAAGTVTINGDIRYNIGTYNSFGSVPKVLIYARNVNISCSVGEVDAIIVTASGGTVNTCSEFPDNTSDLNDSRRSRQLRVFGMVITDNIILGRTYGTAANEGDRRDPYGMPSDGAAAEVFDYDSSTLIWSEYMAGSAETDTLQTVYQHELAPRY